MKNNLDLFPALDEELVISPEQIIAFRRDGFAVTPNLLKSAELAIYRPVILEAAQKLNTENKKLADRDTYGKAFLQIMNLWVADERVKKFTLSKRFAKIAADLLGVKNVRIYHDQALFKEPSGGPTPWHQDQYYWPLDSLNTVTMWMPLVPVTVEMGMLTFASGSHINGCVFDTEISDESETAFDQYVKKHQLKSFRPEHLNAGDATWHYGSTIHQAPGNSSSIMREVMTIIYVADGIRIAKPVNSFQENDRLTWLGGLEPGSLVSAELNPVVL